MEAFTDLLLSISSPEIQANLIVVILKWLSITAGILFLIIILYVTTQTSWKTYSILSDVTEITTYRPYGLRRVGKDFGKIMKRLESNNEGEYKLALIEADTIIDTTLKKAYIAGDTLDDKLAKVTPTVIPNIAELKKAHEVRNKIVYDPDYKLSGTEARKILSEYEAALRALDLID